MFLHYVVVRSNSQPTPRQACTGGGRSYALTKVVDPGEILPPGHLSTPSTYRKCCSYSVLSNNPYLYDSPVYDLRFKVREITERSFFFFS